MKLRVGMGVPIGRRDIAVKTKVTFESKGKRETFWVEPEQARALKWVLEIFNSLDVEHPFDLTGVTRVYLENAAMTPELEKIEK